MFLVGENTARLLHRLPPVSWVLLNAREIFMSAFISEESKHVSLFSSVAAYSNMRKTLLLKYEWLKSVAFP